MEGKLLLWQALEQLPDGRSLEPPLDELIQRARAQRRILGRLRRDAVLRAFT